MSKSVSLLKYTWLIGGLQGSKEPKTEKNKRGKIQDYPDLRMKEILVGGWTNPFEKIWVKMGIFPK